MARLDIYIGGRRIVECPVRGSDVVLGRSPAATVVLPSPEISRVHARIRPDGNRCELIDESVNGTLLNGQEFTKPQTLMDGAVIQIGPYRIVFSTKDGGPPVPTAVNMAYPTRLLRIEGSTIASLEARLEIVPPAKGPPYTFALTDRPVTAGKSPTCDLVLADDFVSRVHARLTPVPEGWRIEDLSSRNGTKVNGRETGAALLTGGDRIQIGQTKLIFHQKIVREPLASGRPAPDQAGSEADGSGSDYFRGSSTAAVHLRQLAARIAPTAAHILILGETGTGKEIFARLLHSLSDRAGRPFEAVNCGAIPENLLESELFGHEKGAFTGADERRDGLFATAAGGTLFLDEIAELPLAGQVKLLRAIESGEIRPLGSQAAVIARPRILAATHADLAARVEKGRFREDLFHRLNVIAVKLPPLRDRLSDLPELVQSFLAGERSLSGAALRKLMQHDWPGNIRELRNVVERAAVLSPDNQIGPESIALEADSGDPLRGGYLDSHPEFRGKSLDQIEAEILRRVLADADGIQNRVAKILGLSRGSLHGKLVRHGLIAADKDTL